MARKPATRAEFTLFDVIYEDGSQRSNRRVPSEVLGGLDGDAPARTIVKDDRPCLVLGSVSTYRWHRDRKSSGQETAPLLSLPVLEGPHTPPSQSPRPR